MTGKTRQFRIMWDFRKLPMASPLISWYCFPSYLSATCRFPWEYFPILRQILGLSFLLMDNNHLVYVTLLGVREYDKVNNLIPEHLRRILACGTIHRWRVKFQSVRINQAEAELPLLWVQSHGCQANEDKESLVNSHLGLFYCFPHCQGCTGEVAAVAGWIPSIIRHTWISFSCHKCSSSEQWSNTLFPLFYTRRDPR